MKEKTDEEKIDEVCRKLDRPEFSVEEVELGLSDLWSNFRATPTQVRIPEDRREFWAKILSRRRTKKRKSKK